MQNAESKDHGVSLYVTLSPQDAQFLRVAITAGPEPKTRPGPEHVGKLAQAVLGSVCRSILAQGYRPRPLLAQLGPQEPDRRLPDNTIKIQFPESEGA